MKNNIRLKTTKTGLLFLLFFIDFFEPQAFFVINGVKQVFFAMMIAFDGYIGLSWCLKKRKSFITVLVIIYHVYLIGVTVLRHGDINGAFHDTLLYIGVCMCTEIVLEWDPSFFTKELLIWLEILVALNLATIVLFPEGLYKSDILEGYYLLGYDNQNINVVLPMLALSFLKGEYGKKNNRKIHFYFSSFLAVLTAIMIKSIASAEVLLIFFLLVIPINFNNTRLFNFRNLWILNILTVIFIVILGGQKYFETLIVTYFRKTMTLSGRTYIWDWSINLIKQRWFWGHGMLTRNNRALLMPSHYKIALIAGLHAHNRYLETMFRGGVILLSILMIMLLRTCNNLMTNKKITVSKVITITLFAYLMGMVTEYYRYAYFFFPLMILSEKVGVIDRYLKVKASAADARSKPFQSVTDDGS